MSSISDTYLNYSGLNSLSEKMTQSTSGSSSTSATGLASQSATFTGSKSEIRSQIDALLANIPKGDDGKLSFEDIDTYRETLETEWDDAVKADLAKLGVNVDEELPLTWDPATGKVICSDGYPDKDIIDRYFVSNPDKIDEFERIIKLGKMTSTHSQKLSASEMRQSIQQQSMSWWYEDNTDPTSWFSGGGTMLGSTMATYKGLNITV